MSENENKAAPEQPAQETLKAMDALNKGKFGLKYPIRDGDREYTELKYDFSSMTAWEMAQAIDKGTNGKNDAFNLTDSQALALFAAAAGKCTEGLDATDIRERMSAADGVAAIKVAAIFFNTSSLAGSLRFTSE